MRRASLLLLCLLWSLVEVHSQTAPYLTFMGETLPNHTYVDLSLMMYPGNDDANADVSTTVICHTDLATCCIGAYGDNQGALVLPQWRPTARGGFQ